MSRVIEVWSRTPFPFVSGEGYGMVADAYVRCSNVGSRQPAANVF
jgi:hypothetical protein